MTTHPRTAVPAGLILVLGALTAIGPLSIDMYLPSLPSLAAGFGRDIGRAELTLSGFFAGLAIGQAFYGPLADRFGRKPPLYLGLVLFLVASIGCALAPSLEALIGLRFVQGLGGCAGMVIARAVVRDRFEHAEAARVFSLLMLVMGLAPILAPLIGGYLLVIASWQAIFALLAGFAVLLLAAVGFGLPETRPAQGELHLGTVLATYAGLLRDREFVGYALSGGFAQAGMFAYIAGSPFVFIELFHVPKEHYGWLFGANALGLIIGSQLNARLLHRLGPETVLGRSTLVIAGFGVLLLSAVLTGAGGFPGLLIPLFGYIASLGFVGPNAAACALHRHGERAGSASAVMGCLQFLAAALAGSLVGQWHDGTALPMAGVIAGCGVLAALARWLGVPQKTRGFTKNP